MNIETNFDQFLEEISLFKYDLIKSLGTVRVENYREDYKGKYSPERFKHYFVEKAALHTVFKYILIRMVEESMKRVKVKLNNAGLKKWHEMSKNYRNDYNLLFEIAVNDVKREDGFGSILEDTVYDGDTFKVGNNSALLKHIPILSKYNFSDIDENITFKLVEKLYLVKQEDELQKFPYPSPVVNFLLQQVGVE